MKVEDIKRNLMKAFSLIPEELEKIQEESRHAEESKERCVQVRMNIKPAVGNDASSRVQADRSMVKQIQTFFDDTNPSSNFTNIDVKIAEKPTNGYIVDRHAFLKKCETASTKQRK